MFAYTLTPLGTADEDKALDGCTDADVNLWQSEFQPVASELLKRIDARK